VAVTIILASIALAGSVRADSPASHATAVVVARAQIMSGIRVGSEPPPSGAKRDRSEAPPPRPREKPCPEQEATPCRMLVVDME
jgi:hypothetical protein